MAEYIEREEVYEMLHALGGCGADPDTWADGWDKAIDTAIEELDDIPAADVRPVVQRALGPCCEYLDARFGRSRQTYFSMLCMQKIRKHKRAVLQLRRSNGRRRK